MAAAPKWCRSDVTQESRAVPQPPRRDSHTNPWGTQLWEQPGQGPGLGTLCQPDTTHPSEQGWAAHLDIRAAVYWYKSITFSLDSQVLLLCCSLGLGQGQQCHSRARHSAPSCPRQAPHFSGISMETSCVKRYKARISFPSSFHSSRTFVPLIVTYFTGTRQRGQSLTHHCAA